ncbi:MAG: prepilin-type N-terminal cleavage/methylation domain-containing protein [Pirellulaceae bacterium]
MTHRSTMPGGFTLLETLVALTAISVVLAASALALSTTYRAELTLREQRRTDTNLSRLELRLRRDVHEANDIHWEPAAETSGKKVNRLRLELAEATSILYRCNDGEVRRELRRGEIVAHRDTFRIDGFELSWRLLQETEAKGVALLLTPKTPGEGVSFLEPLRIEVRRSPQHQIRLENRP